jgi:uncharacterized protein (TIGR03083 family)
MVKDMWKLIHTEREALAADLQRVGDASWETPSLCDRWTVRQVVAHMTATAMMTPPRVLASFAGARFSFSAFADKGVADHLGSSPQETLARFRGAARRETSPPGPAATWIGEAVVHSEDVRRPLGISHTYDETALRSAADFYSRSNALIGAKKRIEGLSLQATDSDWSVGAGPVVRGPLLALVMAMTGRTAFADDLGGDGLGVLTGRL